MLAGFSIGILEFLVDLPVVGTTQLITDGLGISFMMQAWWNFCLCSAIFAAVSLMTPPPDLARIESLTWPNPLSVIFHGRITGAFDPRVVASVMVTGMCVLYYVFA